jgi:hypothetical protein
MGVDSGQSTDCFSKAFARRSDGLCFLGLFFLPLLFLVGGMINDQ